MQLTQALFVHCAFPSVVLVLSAIVTTYCPIMLMSGRRLCLQMDSLMIAAITRDRSVTSVIMLSCHTLFIISCHARVLILSYQSVYSFLPEFLFFLASTSPGGVVLLPVHCHTIWQT